MLILASASPRRRELLTQAGLKFEAHPADIDESPLPDEPAAAYVQRLAIEKAQAVCVQRQQDYTGTDPMIVLAADTAVVLQGHPEVVLGKPLSVEDAERMLGLLSGRTHTVMTGIAAASPGVATVADVELTQVTFNLLSMQEIANYVRTGEPLDKAGAYGIQGHAARWIPRIEGDYFNVVGLPISRVVGLLDEVELAARELNATK